jgi:hypothetical protein
LLRLCCFILTGRGFLPEAGLSLICGGPGQHR